MATSFHLARLQLKAWAWMPVVLTKPSLCGAERRGDRRKSLPTWCVLGRDFRRVHASVIRRSAAEPDGPGVDAPVTLTFIRRSNAEPDEPRIIRPFCPNNVIFMGFSSSFARGVLSAKA